MSHRNLHCSACTHHCKHKPPRKTGVTCHIMRVFEMLLRTTRLQEYIGSQEEMRYFPSCERYGAWKRARCRQPSAVSQLSPGGNRRSEEHTSELQSLRHLVCRLLLEQK